MNCVYCNSDTKVVNSRLQKKANQVWRRRECKNCRAVFTSLEGVVTSQALMLLESGRLEPFYRDKLFLSIHDSLKHRKTALSDATALTDTILGKLYKNSIKDAVINKKSLVETTANTLKHFDNAAFTHYKAFHQS